MPNDSDGIHNSVHPCPGSRPGGHDDSNERLLRCSQLPKAPNLSATYRHAGQPHTARNDVFQRTRCGHRIIQDGEVIYAKGFGMRNFASGEPFTLDTVYRIGSNGKAITSMLVATEVDKGLVAWDTPVHSLRSDFRLPNQELTDTIQVQQLMNMGTGIDDAPFLEYADLDSPQHLWHTVKDLKVVAPPETKFLYNNSIYALGGYVGALAQGVPIPKLLDYYKSAVKEPIFDPIGMPTSEVTDYPETLSNNVATPYKYDLTEDVFPLHPNTYSPIRAVTPAGGIASTMNDMTRYVITQLQGGVAPNGNRVVSALNLEKTWKGQIQ